ncbi:alpha/beta hydrolase, partial [Candidatus Woesearchaeota archaeon]|nr:alpha/beta hydrolase [Candidatus Woesearchaeota archaeon]
GANKCWKECEDLHLLLTEIFPGTVVMFPENKISKEEAVNVPVAAENIVSEEVLTSLEEGAFVSITGAQVVSGSSEHGTGENGIVLHDETSEDVDNTWELLLACPGMGPGECEQYSPEPISSPEPFGVDWPYAYEPEEEPVACGYVSDSASTNRINPQYTGDEFTIPLGYEIIKGPFSMECVGDSFDFSFNVPDNFRNVKVLRCRGLMCTEVLLSETPVEELVCDGEVVSTQIGDEFNTRQPALDPLMLDVVIDVEKSLDINNVIQEKGYSVEFDVSGFDVRLFTPKDFVSAPENAHYYFMGAPIVIEADVPENIGAVITMPLVPREDYSGFGIFVFVDGEWRSLESRVSNGFVSARVDDLKSLMVDNRVMFAVMGMYCHTCVGTEFKKVYDGGSKEAVVLVHGLTSTPATWQYMISDFSLSRQPHQVWVFGYPSSMSLDDVSIALANHLHEHSSEYNKIHLVGHSLGGLIIQQAVNFGNLNKYGFVSKVNKEILVGTPNKGSPAAKIYDSLRTFLINSKKLAGVYFLNPLVIDDVVNGRNIPRVPGIKYFVVAGTKSYPFSLGYFDNVNDGIVSVDSARFVGGIECGDMCSNYFEIDLTHTDLISHPIARNVIEYIISLEQSIEYPDLALLGFNQYGHTWIDECSPSDQFVIVGQRIAELETPGILDCRCGDDICGEGETVFSCPADCAMAIGAWICPWLPSAIPVLLLIAVVLTSVYLVTKRLQKKEVSTAWKIIDYAVVIISVILLILGIIICRYVSLLAIIILLIIIILLLLDLFFSGKKEKFAKIKKISKKKRK